MELLAFEMDTLFHMLQESTFGSMMVSGNQPVEVIPSGFGDEAFFSGTLCRAHGC